jgi:DNA-directed RNA polymerase subunit RPC12/RpoP
MSYAPPTLRELLANDLYKAFFKKRPPEPVPSPLNHPWQVWAYNGETERWGSRLCKSYPDAYKFTRELFATGKYVDIAIVSRTIIHDVPRPLKLAQPWDPYQFDWCGRCRRPTIFRYMPSGHRALHNAPAITTDEPYRCYYCGVRKVLAGKALT